jgi:sulfoxide reductase heme-binding subunit YedZ
LSDAASSDAAHPGPARGAPPEPHDHPTAPPARHHPAADRTTAPRRPRNASGPAVWAGPVILGLAVAPAVWLVTRVVTNDLGADPIETLEHATGHWTLRFLALTLLVTPLQKLLGWSWLVKHRRTLGLTTFAYGTIHLLVYVGLDMQLMLGLIVEDVVEHPYVTIGMLTWLLLLPLAVTSTKGWIRRLGGRRWNALHRLVYICAVTGTVHYLWAVKKDVRDPLIYATLFAALLGYRLWMRLGRRTA